MHEHSYVVERIIVIIVITKLVVYQNNPMLLWFMQNVHAEN